MSLNSFLKIQRIISLILVVSFAFSGLTVSAETFETKPADEAETSTPSNSQEIKSITEEVDQATQIQGVEQNISNEEKESTENPEAPMETPQIEEEIEKILDEEKPTEEEKAPDESTETGVPKSATTPSPAFNFKGDNQPVKKDIKVDADQMTGALLLNYPIVTPPGRNGLQPDLILSYNSGNQDIDSVFGQGWSINIPYIERINKTGLEDMYSQNYFNSSLSGELSPMYLFYSIYGEYGPKVEEGDFLRYNYTLDNYWEVVDKNGLTYKFGSTAFSRQDDPNDSTKIFKWMLEEVRDPNNNFIRYEYFKSDGQIYPSKIKYTGFNYTDGIFEVEFTRTSRQDDATVYDTDFRVATSSVINVITTKINDGRSVPVKEYWLNYTSGVNGKKSLLSGIEESSRGEEVSEMIVSKPDQFEYGTPSQSFSQTSPYTIPFNLSGYFSEDNGVRIIDVNGDSLADILYTKVNSNSTVTKTTYLNKGINLGWQTSTSYISPVTFADRNGEDEGIKIADINGDGFIDFVVSNQDIGVQEVYLNNKVNGWTQNRNYQIPIYFVDRDGNSLPVYFAEVNGDSLPDILDGSTNSVYLNKSDGTGWDFGGLGYLIPVELDEPGTRIADVNGDGLDDILYSFEGRWQGVFINTGNPNILMGWQSDANYTIPVPFNREDCYDCTIEDNGVRIVDINGDGLDDILYAKDTDIANKKVYINKGDGTGWVANSSYSIPKPFVTGYGYEDNGVQLADINGDGLTDFLFRNDFYGETSKVYINDTNSNYRSPPDQMTMIYSRNGGRSQIDYKPTPQYIDTSNNPLNPKLPFILSTVVDIFEFDGINGQPAGTYYEYSGGEYYYASPLDRKFAGFGVVKKTDDFGNIEKTYYHQGNTSDSSHGELSDHVSKIGKIYLTEIINSSNRFFLKTFNKWENTSLGGNRYFVKLTEQVEQNFDGGTNFKSKAERYTYDNANGNLTQRLSMGEVNSNANGSITSDSGSDSITTLINYAVDSYGKIRGLPYQERIQNQSGVMLKKSNYYYDNLASGSVLKGNLTRRSDWISGSTYADSTKVYNTYGLVIQETDPRNSVTNYMYDQYLLYPSRVTNPLNQYIYYLYDYSSGSVRQITDPNNLVFKTIYDAKDRPLYVMQPNPTSPTNLVYGTIYNYSDHGTPETQPFPSFMSEQHVMSDTAGGPIKYTYFDGFGRTIQERQEIEDPSIYSVKDYQYNKVGLVEKESIPYISNGSSRTSPTTSNNLLIRYAYDPLGRPTSITNAVGTVSNTYDRWKLTVRDVQNNTKEYLNDAHGNLIEVAEYNAGSVYRTRYEYDGLGDLTKITDALGNIKNMTYDAINRKTSEQDFHTSTDTTFGTYRYVYDNNGNLTSQTDPKNQTINYTYDRLNRPLTEDFTGLANTEVTYSYDTCTYGKGRLCTAYINAVATSYTYNPLGMMATETRQIDGITYITRFNYDWMGNILSITYPDNIIVNYGYDTTAGLQSVQVAGRTIVSNINYEANREMKKIEYTNGTAIENVFDTQKLYRLSSKKTKKAGTSLQDIAYTYDSAGDITRIVDASPSTIRKTANYQYDNLYRLTSASVTNTGNNSNYNQTYQYNAIGNITNKSDQGTYSYRGNEGTSYATPHAVTNIGTKTLSYDNNGNILSDGSQTFIWDYKNRMTQSTSTLGTMQYFYDCEGNRVKKLKGIQSTIYPNKYFEKTGNSITKHVFAGDLNVASIVPVQNENETVYEDAEDGLTAGWGINNPSVSTIQNLPENTQQGRVIVLGGISTGWFLLNNEDGTAWNNSTNKIFKMDFRYSENFIFRVNVNTNNGARQIWYSPGYSTGVSTNGTTITINIASSLRDGNWHTLQRDLQADITSLQPGTTINSVSNLYVFGRGKVDNIKLLKCDNGQCVPNPPPVCVPATCTSLGRQCGSGYANGCGGTLSCGNCQSGYTCNSSSQCIANQPATPETICDDGLDNDNDGKPDAGDTDCANKIVSRFYVWCRGGCSLNMLNSTNELFQFLLPACVLGTDGLCGDPALGVQQSFTTEGQDGVTRLWVSMNGTSPALGVQSTVPMIFWKPPDTSSYPYQPSTPGTNATSISLPALNTGNVVFMRIIPAGVQ